MRASNLLIALLLTSSAALAAAPVKPGPAIASAKDGKDAKATPPAPTKFSQAPLPGTPRWSHAPFEDGNCAICHERKDPKNPGKITGSVNELCNSCHEDFAEMLKTRENKHNPVKKSCTNCHNAHNSNERKLLLGDMTALCFSCHEVTKDDIATAKVSHSPVMEEGKCMNCHNPHASNVQSLLIAMPFDLCVNCHGKDGMKDSAGQPMTNLKKLLGANKTHHKPVENKDCSACHVPHGGANFRLLVDAYPAEFYAPYEPENYALCFECHKSEIVRDPETTTLTKFRDGSRNLHYLHVNNAERGRTCRACHEVHASQQPHIIRDAVPYGSRGWMLKINFNPADNGGSCAKTCHGVKPYNNKTAGKVAPAPAPGKTAPGKPGAGSVGAGK